MVHIAQPPRRGRRTKIIRSPRWGGFLPSFPGKAISQTLMRTLAVIPGQPGQNLDPGFPQAVEQFGTEKFLPERPVKTLQVPVVIGLALG
jgi:hypothetical protein